MQYVTVIYTILDVSLQSGCAQNVSSSTIAVTVGAIRIHGRYRPHRVRVLSLSVPMIGSLMASQKRDTNIRMDTAAILIPNTSV